MLCLLQLWFRDPFSCPNVFGYSDVWANKVETPDLLPTASRVRWDGSFFKAATTNPSRYLSVGNQSRFQDEVNKKGKFRLETSKTELVERKYNHEVGLSRCCRTTRGVNTVIPRKHTDGVKTVLLISFGKIQTVFFFFLFCFSS